MVKECVICIDPVQNDSDCKMLSCFHIFHSDCITNWLVTTSSCPMCNKAFRRREHIKLDLKKHQMNAINVDNEYFYSDHIIVRKPDLLDDREYKQALICALPNEYSHIVNGTKKKKPPADQTDESDNDFDQIDENTRKRKRSKSLGDFENQKLQLKNMEDKWGKGMWDISNYESDKGLVGPLKIVRLPSDRTPAVTI